VPLNGWSLWHHHKGVDPLPACIVLVFWSTGLNRLAPVLSSFFLIGTVAGTTPTVPPCVVWGPPTFTAHVMWFDDCSYLISLPIYSSIFFLWWDHGVLASGQRILLSSTSSMKVKYAITYVRFASRKWYVLKCFLVQVMCSPLKSTFFLFSLLFDTYIILAYRLKTKLRCTRNLHKDVWKKIIFPYGVWILQSSTFLCHVMKKLLSIHWYYCSLSPTPSCWNMNPCTTSDSKR
jgi:hypothetical protein